MSSGSVVLDGLVADPEVFVLRCCLDDPAALDLHDAGAVTVLIGERGRVRIDRGGAHAEIGPGDVLVMTGTAPYLLKTSDAASLSARVDAQHRCHTIDGRPLKDEWALGLRMWGHRADADTRILVATVDDESLAVRLEAAVGSGPHVVPGMALASRYADALAAEADAIRPLEDGVMARLAELVALEAARRISRPTPIDPADLRIDEVVATVRENLGAPWTVARMAKEATMSRSNFSARFTARFGDAPAAALARWRMDAAASVLASTDDTVDAVARSVGYADGFAFSDAFQRVVGVRPSAFRRTA